ncbi:hypothetical protein JOD17_003157 [Geomicrobium sediminis]|uniref:Uncharacterized protein n=1 Tax=Geomicrobium sediminis TaxID=1347788 RepID=A0ABS2PF49_9BACL|nr:hypothetical protein [Geomicrobium sediminis]
MDIIWLPILIAMLLPFIVAFIIYAEKTKK